MSRAARRILYVTEHWPWPSNSGARMRAAATVQALATMGQVDVVFLDRGWFRQVPNEPYPLTGESVTFTVGPLAAWTAEEHLYPAEVAKVSRIFRDRLRNWVGVHDYDLVWCNRLTTWTPLRGTLSAPTVIDVDDLNDRLYLQSHAATGEVALAEDAGRWAQLQRIAGQESDRLVVCSELDRQRLCQRGNSGVVPNVYLESADVEPVPSDDPRPRILLPGIFVWPPNLEAAWLLVHEILPMVRTEFADACVWLVGMHRGRLDNLSGADVRVFGLVPDMRPYVRAADVVAVPLRQGSGTRLKLLESFALGTPVVSTTLGAEGIAARHDEHLLIADSSENFAGAVCAVLRHADGARQMARRAQDMVERDYGWDVLLDSVRDAVQRAEVAFRR